MKFKGIGYTQQDQKYISTVLPFKVISVIAEPLIYGHNKYGYQRELDKKHYTKISKVVKKDAVPLPTSIILGINENEIERYIGGSNDGVIDLIFNESILKNNIKEFRIVDGQHRIKALEILASEDKEFEEYPLNVIILITNERRRVVEVEVFKDINSKGKKITTDLTLLAQHNYELLGEKEITEVDVVDHIGVKVAYRLSETIEKSIWHKGIKLDIHTKDIKGIIGISAFNNSLKPLTKYFIDKNHTLNEIKNKPESSIDITECVADNMVELINQAWWIVYKKWTFCFELDEFDKTFYNEDYYLQKTTGVNAVHTILYESIKDVKEKSTEEILGIFSRKINNSNLKVEDWEVGGQFAGLTSKSGFAKAKTYILGDLK